MSPRVTVLLAVHNGEPYLGGAIESVFAQTSKDFELLVVDDASTDGTAALLAALRDKRVRILRNETNLGQVPSLNRGLREARGEYVARLDADDWCRPTRLARQVAALDAEPRVGLVGSWLDVVDDHDRPVAALRERIDDLVRFAYQTLIMRVYVTHPAAMYRRQAVLDVDGYDESTGPSEDKDLWRRLLLAGWDARIVPEPLLVYRLHEQQLSHVHADYQRWIDGESQDRFLATLAPTADVTPLRLVLAGDARAWEHDVSDVPAVLDNVLTALAIRLSLSHVEAQRLRTLAAGRACAVAAARPWRRDARELIRSQLAHLSPSGRAQAVSRCAVAPPVDALRRGARTVARAPGWSAVRGRVRRIPAARRLYGKHVGGG